MRPLIRGPCRHRVNRDPSYHLSVNSDDGSLLPTVGRMPVPTARQLHDSQKSPIRDVLDVRVSRTATQPCSRFDDSEVVMIRVHDQNHDQVMPQPERVGSWLWLPTLVLVSISFSLIIVFSRPPPWPRPLLIPSFSNATAQVPSDTTFSSPTSPVFSSNGRTDQVQWDNYTLVLRGQRVLI